MGEPIQYVSRNDESVNDIQILNDLMLKENKATKDKQLSEWFYICGTSFRLTFPTDESASVPFETYTVDPRNCFVVYSADYKEEPVMGVVITQTTDFAPEATPLYSVYTKDAFYEIGGVDSDSLQVREVQDLTMGAIPLIEYPANEARLGAFEIVLPLLDAMNNVSSNRLDGIEQFIQALLVFQGVDIDADDFELLKSQGAIKIPNESEIKYLIQQLDQSNTQTLADSLYQTVLTIVGMPNRNGGTSTSDTGSAVILRDGWSDAEARAKDNELSFVESERQFLQLVLEIIKTFKGFSLAVEDVDILFTRRNYENIQGKAQVLTTLLSNDKIHPRLAFESSGMFIDPEQAYTESIAYFEEQQAKQTETLSQTTSSTLEQQGGGEVNVTTIQD